jgi:multiple sugar transport system permease protein
MKCEVRKVKIFWKIAAAAVLCIIGILFFFPVYWMAVTSFKLPAQVFSEKPILLLDALHLDNYVEIFRKANVVTFFLNSLCVALSVTLITILLSTMAGFALSRYKFPWNRKILSGVLLVRMIPAIVYTIPYYIIYARIGLLDNLLGLCLAYCSSALPLGIWLAVSFLSDIPGELYESASMDGCSEYRMYLSVAMPLAVPGIIVIAILVFINCWNEFGLALVLQSSDAQKTLPIGIASMVQTHKDTPSGSLAAAGVIAMIPAFIISALTQKYIVKGLMTGAVKG